jgi:Asp-tRNA(Asn)/Glu-tRNA(Gln) amidotransferase A subunit family amidase
MRPDEYLRFDGLGLAERVRTGEVKAEELLDAALEISARVNPRINALILFREEAARAELARVAPDAPFRGVPFPIKDLHLQIAGTITTNGCALFRDAVGPFDSTLVQRYRAAGLVLFARSTTPEFGLTLSTESALWGATRNPWDLSRMAGGSSGGAAAAVAAGIAPLANASDGGGSIRIPASACGLFGLKPTRIRTPLGPVHSESWYGLSSVHAITRSVRDSAALLDATAGPELGDPYCAPPPARPYLEEVGAPPGRLRIALVRSAPTGVGVEPECLRAVDDAARLCAELGHEVEEAVPPLDWSGLGRATMAIICASTRVILENRARDLGRELAPTDVEPVTWFMVESALRTTGLEMVRARDAILRAARDMGRFQERWDAILSPTLARVPLPIGACSLSRDVDEYFREIATVAPFTSAANVTGQPAMSVPLHWTPDGIPVGVMFAGRFGDEATLFRLAAQLEQARPWAHRRPPLPSTEEP